MTPLYLKTLEIVQEINRRMLAGEFKLTSCWGLFSSVAKYYNIEVEGLSFIIELNRDEELAYFRDDSLVSSIEKFSIQDDFDKKILFMQMLRKINKECERTNRNNA